MGLFLFISLIFGLRQGRGGFAASVPSWVGWWLVGVSAYACGIFANAENHRDLVPWVLLISALLMPLGLAERWVDLLLPVMPPALTAVMTWLGKRRERLSRNPLRDLLQAVESAQVG
jgi:hypothetical protein